MQKNRKCNGLFGRLFGHEFEPRFNIDTKTPAGTKFESNTITTRAIEAIKDRKETYMGDVCTRCGLTTNRPVELPDAKE